MYVSYATQSYIFVVTCVSPSVTMGLIAYTCFFFILITPSIASNLFIAYTLLLSAHHIITCISVYGCVADLCHTLEPGQMTLSSQSDKTTRVHVIHTMQSLTRYMLYIIAPTSLGYIICAIWPWLRYNASYVIPVQGWIEMCLLCWIGVTTHVDVQQVQQHAHAAAFDHDMYRIHQCCERNELV